MAIAINRAGRASGIVRVAVLIPLQSKPGAMAKAFSGADAIPPAYWPLEAFG